MHVVRIAAVAAALSPVVSATDIVKPSGFNVETLVSPPPVVELTLADGTRLVRGGFFGAEELFALHADGSLTLWATGFGSIAGLAQSPLTGDVVAGDSATLGASLIVLRDLDGDGDALDAGERVPHPVQPPLLSDGQPALPFDLSFRPGTDELYMSASTNSFPTTGAVTLTVDGAVHEYAVGFGYAGDLVWVDDDLLVGDTLALDFTGRVAMLRDLDGDGDALDAGEQTTFAGGFDGAGGLVALADGSFLLGTGFGGTIARMLGDGDGDGASDGVDPAWASGFGWAGTLVLAEGAGGFVPGLGGDGVLRVDDFTFFDGVRTLRSAPLAALSVSGVVANDSLFTLSLAGAPGAEGAFLLTLDPQGVTLPGIGDLTGGFGAPWVLVPFAPLDAGGTRTLDVIFHGLPALVGQDLAIQGVTLEAGRFGLSTGARFVIG